MKRELKRRFVYLFCAGLGMAFSAVVYAGHPVLNIPNVSDSETKANAILNTWPNDDNFASRYVPRSSPRSDYGKYAPMVVPGDTRWEWSASDEQHIKSMPSGTIFPGAAGYTEHVDTVTVLSGNTVEVPYYLAAGSTTERSLVQGNIDYYKSVKLHADLKILSDAYMDSGPTHATRTQAYARRICAILYEWAQYAPDYYMTVGTFDINDKNPQLRDTKLISGGPDFEVPGNMSYFGAFNGFGEEVNEEIIYAYDVVYDSPELDVYAAEKGKTAAVFRQFIDDNLMRVMGDFFVKHATPSVGTEGNLPSVGRNLSLMATVCGFDDYMPWIEQYYDYMLRTRFTREAVLLEGMGYSLNFVRTVQTGCKFATGYYDVRPATTPEEEAFLADLQSHVDFLQMGADRFGNIALPNRYLPAFGDTRDQVFFNVADKANGVASSSALDSYGSLSLGAGNRMATAIQLNQNYTGQANHMRLDSGAFTLWAFGKEVLGNIRYSRGAKERQFSEQPLAHNSVRIQAAQASAVYSSTTTRDEDVDGVGDLTLYEPGEQGIGVSELDCNRLYDGYADRYQRIMVLNGSDLEQPYVLDIFRVKGIGKLDYSIHGSLKYDSTASCSKELNPWDKSYPFNDSDTWQGVQISDQYSNFKFENMFRNGDGDGTGTDTAMRKSLNGDFKVSFTAADAANPDVNIWMLDRSFNHLVYLCESPTPTRSNALPASMFTADLWRPSFIVKNAPADSTFASVIEPKRRGTSGIVSSANLPLDCAENDGTAFQITFDDGRVDTWLINHKNPDVQGGATGQDTIATLDGVFQLTGRIGLHSKSGDKLKVWVMDATEFIHPDGTYTPAAQLHYAGAISGETRVETDETYDAFITSTPLPTGTALRGKYMRLNFGALVRGGTDTQGISEVFEIDEVVEVGGVYHIKTRYDHFLNITGGGADSREQRMPNRHFVGAHSFDIILSEGADSGLMDSISAVQSGAINDPATWGVPVPVAGDTNVWLTGSQTISMAANTETFHGKTFVVQSGGKFVPGKPSATLSLNGLILAGGEIYMGNNIGLNIDLGGDTLQLDGGSLKSGGANSQRDVRFRNAVLDGGGKVKILGTDANGSEVTFENSVDVSGFAGIFEVGNFGILNLPPIVYSNATFSIELTGSGLYLNDRDIAVRSLTINGEVLPSGIYAYADFTPAQQAYLIDTSGVITVLNDPAGDTDGDGTSDTDELAASRMLDSATDLAFEFNTDAEGWSVANNITNETIVAGSFQGETVTADPILVRGNLNFDADAVTNLIIKLKASSARGVQLYWTHTDSGTYVGKFLNASYGVAGAWQAIVMPVSTHAEWAGKTITKLRIDPIGEAGASFEIDWIRASDGDLDNDGVMDVDEPAGDSDGDGRLDIEAAKTLYELWADDFTLAGTRSDDDDNDGIPNVYEYGFGGNPTNGIVDGTLPTLGQLPGGFEYVHVQRSALDSRISYSVVACTNLMTDSWSNGGVEFIGSGTIDSVFDTVTNHISTEVESTQFIRLIIE